MNNEEPYRDQAERLKQRIEKINVKFDDNEELPPREHIHRQKKQKTKWKLKYPVIRLLVLFFILLPIIIFSVISYQDGAKKVDGVEQPADESVGYETINLEKPIEEDETKVDSTDPSEESISENIEMEEPNGETKDEVNQSETSSNTVDNPNENKNNTSVIDNGVQEKKAEATEEKETTAKEPKKSIVTHTVKPNENLYRIAMLYYHSPKGTDIIMKANNLRSKQINAGQVLRIPMNN